ncbi:transposase [Succinivibrio sp.]|uniref:IS66 family transposase n=1 Tax=Succinivibrio sp. TaxID=2053619 RepID=UPI0025EC5421|nr:transposase [Succinivibrio sp.]MBQ9221955.1 transposase [Succinivibrio sp.]
MQKIRRHNFNKLKHKENTLISKTDEFEMIDIGENEYVIEPWSFGANTYSLLPAFQKSKLSIGVQASASAIFCQMGVPKNKISTVYDGEGFPISRDQLTGGINCFARAFLPNVARQIKKDILRTSESVLFDESSLLVMETKYKKLSEGKNSKKSVIWVMSSSWVSPIAACWYQVTPSRSHQTLLDFLEKLDIQQHAKFMVSDGYSGYFKAARKLRKEKNIDIQNASCWCHGRRPLHKYLRDAGLLKIYNRYLLPDGSLFTSFTDNLKKYQAEPKERILEDKERDLLIIYYLINALFVIDSSVVIEHGFELTNEAFKESLMKARNERSRPIVEAIFDAIKIFIARNPMIIKACYEDNKVTYVPNEFFAESKALLYLIRHEAELRVFLTDPSIELTQSSCERALKAAISVRRNCQKLQSEDGAHALPLQIL